MPHLVPLSSIPVTRNGVRVIPPVGMAFEFSDDEAKFLGPDVARKANSEDAKGIAKPAIAGKTVVAFARRNREATNALAKAAEALAAAAEGRAITGTAAVPEATPTRRARSQKITAEQQPAAEEGDDL